MIIKNLKVQKPEAAAEAVTFIASTATPDRYGDVVQQDGWDLRAYERNPVILFNHNPHQMPIGKGKAYVKDGRLMIDVVFDKEDELAQSVERKVRSGFINAVSVGFQPKSSIKRSSLPSDHPYHGSSGYLFPKSELLEVSVVTIPANNEATLSKRFQRVITLADVARSLHVNKHVVSVQQLENGNYLVEYAGDEPEEVSEAEEVVEEAMEEQLEEEKSGHEEDENLGYDKEDEEEKKAFNLDDFLKEIKKLNRQ